MARKAGRGDPIITEGKLREFLGQLDPPIAGTTQIAEEFDVSTPGAIDRLATFQERGVVKKVEIGQSFGWWLQEGHSSKSLMEGSTGTDEAAPLDSPTGTVEEEAGEGAIRMGDGWGADYYYVRGIEQQIDELWNHIFEQRNIIRNQFKNIANPLLIGGLAYVIGRIIILGQPIEIFGLVFDGRTIVGISQLLFGLAIFFALRYALSLDRLNSGLPQPGDRSPRSENDNAGRESGDGQINDEE